MSDIGFGGLYLYVAASIKNLGDVPITLSSLISHCKTEQYLIGDSYSNSCFEKDYVTPMYLPIVIESHTVERVLIKFPWCVPKSDSGIASLLTPNFLYSGKEFVDSLAKATRRIYPSPTPLSKMLDLFWSNYRNGVASDRDSLDIVIKADFASGAEIIRKIHIRPTMDDDVIPRWH